MIFSRPDVTSLIVERAKEAIADGFTAMHTPEDRVLIAYCGGPAVATATGDGAAAASDLAKEV